MILQKQITTTNATILIIGGLPEDVVNFSIYDGDLCYYVKTHDNAMCQELPSGNWQPLGFLKDITEDVAKELVDSSGYYDPYLTPFGPIPTYKDYLNNVYNVYKWNATESLHSLVEANCLLKNPFGETWKGEDIKEGYWTLRHEWQSEQEKVFINPFLLKLIA